MAGTEPVVTIDGPSGVGKSTISRLLAARLRYAYLDTGAMYRAIAWACRERGLDLEDAGQLSDLLDTLQMQLLPPGHDNNGEVRVLLNGQELGAALRTPEMGLLASKVSAQPLVREKLTKLQQQIGTQGHIVAEGRDTGTVVFPRARWKFYLDARPEIRAARRAAQLRAKGEAVDDALLLAQIIKRDRDDQERAIAPLKAAEDAIRIDTSERPVNEILDMLCASIAESDKDCRQEPAGK